MRIGIDARCLEWQRGGVARYLSSMLRLWPRLTARHRFVLYFQNAVPSDSFLRHPLFEHCVIAGPRWLKRRRILVEQVLMPSQIKDDGLDLFFGTWYSAPLRCPAPKTVVGAWDISFTTHKDHYRLADRVSLGYFSRKSCQRASGIITCSTFDGRQIERYYHVSLERICVVRLAVDGRFRPATDEAGVRALREKYGLPERYILSLGVIFNRRNVDTIIRAFRAISDEYPEMALVVVGRNATVPRVDINGLMRPLISANRGRYLTWIPEEDVVALYQGAWFYICTSTVDGETVMLKEAMSCGTPVITSPMLSETIGDSGMIVEDPSSAGQVADALRRVIAFPELRAEYSQRALKWMSQFSWTDVAEQSLRFLESR